MGILRRITQSETFQQEQIIGLNVTRLLSGNEKHTHFLIVILKLRIEVRDSFFIKSARTIYLILELLDMRQHRTFIGCLKRLETGKDRRRKQNNSISFGTFVSTHNVARETCLTVKINNEVQHLMRPCVGWWPREQKVRAPGDFADWSSENTCSQGWEVWNTRRRTSSSLFCCRGKLASLYTWKCVNSTASFTRALLLL